MIRALMKKYRKHKEKSIFKEYGTKVEMFNLSREGIVYYAQ